MPCTNLHSTLSSYRPEIVPSFTLTVETQNSCWGPPPLKHYNGISERQSPREGTGAYSAVLCLQLPYMVNIITFSQMCNFGLSDEGTELYWWESKRLHYIRGLLSGSHSPKDQVKIGLWSNVCFASQRTSVFKSSVTSHLSCLSRL